MSVGKRLVPRSKRLQTVKDSALPLAIRPFVLGTGFLIQDEGILYSELAHPISWIVSGDRLAAGLTLRDQYVICIEIYSTDIFNLVIFLDSSPEIDNQKLEKGAQERGHATLAVPIYLTKDT